MSNPRPAGRSRPSCTPISPEPKCDTETGEPWVDNRTPRESEPSTLNGFLDRTREAVGSGFEPEMDLMAHAGFQDRCFQPLSHPTRRVRNGGMMIAKTHPLIGYWRGLCRKSEVFETVQWEGASFRWVFCAMNGEDGFW
jgi:hypothetical protein